MQHEANTPANTYKQKPLNTMVIQQLFKNLLPLPRQLLPFISIWSGIHVRVLS